MWKTRKDMRKNNACRRATPGGPNNGTASDISTFPTVRPELKVLYSTLSLHPSTFLSALITHKLNNIIKIRLHGKLSHPSPLERAKRWLRMALTPSLY